MKKSVFIHSAGTQEARSEETIYTYIYHSSNFTKRTEIEWLEISITEIYNEGFTIICYNYALHYR
jgi:hypothetical protein